MSAVRQILLAAAPESEIKTERAPRILILLTVVTAIAVGFGVALALGYAGTDVLQGEVQRIFYIHVSSFAGAFVAFAVTVFGGIAYLRTRSTKWDRLALAGVEVGLALSLINLTTGSIWARPIWNTWWTWDPRLTSAAIMVLTYFAYLMLRNGIENIETRRRFASVYGILAFASVIVTLVIIRIRPDTIHPAVIGPSPQNAQGGFEMTERMRTTLGINSFIWSVLVPLTLIWWRVRLERLNEYVQTLRARVLEK